MRWAAAGFVRRDQTQEQGMKRQEAKDRERCLIGLKEKVAMRLYLAVRLCDRVLQLYAGTEKIFI